jgi:type IV secretion system protein VirB2
MMVLPILAQAPISTSPIGAAAAWLMATLSGPLVTTIAVIAVASVGFAMLSGRIELRRGFAVLLGCFILFGAGSIARGLVAFTQVESAPLANRTPSPPVYPKAYRRNSQGQPFDPYAGAAVGR